MFAYFIGNLLIAQIKLYAQTGGPQFLCYLGSYIPLAPEKYYQYNLERRQPQRERAGMVLDQDTDEALHRTQDGAMQHHRRFAAVVFIDELRTQSHRQIEIQLYRAALPQTTQAVFQCKFDLGTIERAFARLDIICQTILLQRRSQAGFGLVPSLVRSDPFYRARGQLDQHLIETEIAIYLIQHHDELGYFGLHLRFGTENMRTILGKAAHPHQAVQRSGSLVAMAGTEFRQTQRQVAVAVQAVVEDLHVTWAVHRLHCLVAIF